MNIRKSNKCLNMTLWILCLFHATSVLFMSCKRESPKVSFCDQCADTARVFYTESQDQLTVSFYPNKTQFNRLRFLLHSNCNDSFVSMAGYHIFYSYIVKDRFSEDNNLALTKLTDSEIEEALYGLQKASKMNIPSCNYILGVFYLNGYGVKKDKKRGLKLLSKCRNLARIEEDMVFHSINTNNLDSLYYIPPKYRFRESE